MAEKVYKPSTKVKVDYFSITIVDGGFRFNQIFLEHLYSKLKVNPEIDKIGVKLSYEDEKKYLYFKFFKGNVVNREKLSIISKNVFKARPIIREEKWINEFYQVTKKPIKLLEVQNEKNKWFCDLSMFKKFRTIDIKDISTIESGIKGCYFLYQSDKLVYIGISKTEHGIKNRISEHLQNKLFDKIEIFEFYEDSKIEEFEYLKLEEYYNDHNQYPKYNIVAGKKKLSDLK